MCGWVCVCVRVRVCVCVSVCVYICIYTYMHITYCTVNVLILNYSSVLFHFHLTVGFFFFHITAMTSPGFYLGYLVKLLAAALYILSITSWLVIHVWF